MPTRSTFKAPLALLASVALGFPSSTSSAQTPTTVKNVVLVHGAFADGSSYAKVIPLLEARGLHVIAVQNPLSSLADDVAAAKRAIALQNGPVILVGHSWGGMVISEAGNMSPPRFCRRGASSSDSVVQPSPAPARTAFE